MVVKERGGERSMDEMLEGVVREAKEGESEIKAVLMGLNS